MTHNVTVELRATDVDPDVLAAQVPDQYDAVVHATPYGRAAVTLTLPTTSVVEAVRQAQRLCIGWGLGSAYAVTAMPTEEYDQRAFEAPLPLLLTVPEAAARLGVSEQRIRQLLEADRLSGIKVGRDWAIQSGSVDRRLAEMEEAS